MYYIQVPTIVGLDKAPSPNGKATDSDSVIFKVRILVAQLRALRLKCSFLLLRKIEPQLTYLSPHALPSSTT